jgi:competence protein ComEC
VADPGVAAGKEVFLRALEAARGREVPWRILEAGDSLNLDGVAMRVVSPDTLLPDANASSLVLELRFGAFAALLTGDAPREREEVLLSRLLSPRIHVLKVGHHGSRTSTSPELLERIRPEVAIVSAGRRNRFGHPHPVVLELLREGGVEILRTDREGLVRIRARKDGTYRIRTSREGGPA